MDKLEQLRLDLEELKQLAGQAKRPKVSALLSLEIRRTENEIINQEKAMNESLSETCAAAAALNFTKKSSSTQCYDVKLTNYAWDQSEKFVKIYVTLADVHSIPKENVLCDYTAKSMNLSINSFNGKNYSLPITNLQKAVIPAESHFKIKTDMIIVFLKKADSGNWTQVTAGVTPGDKQSKEPRVPKPDDDSDPSKNLMDLMKQMYDEGDDEMKRTIAKAWTESRDKPRDGGL